ncbi:hypothetical protein CR513_16432, partial [Mucuna pruriens]
MKNREGKNEESRVGHPKEGISGGESADMEPYVGKLYGFAREQVEIRGGIELETTFGERSYARAHHSGAVYGSGRGGVI